METRAIFVLLGLLATAAVSADVWRWVDDEGVVHFSDTPREGAERIVVIAEIDPRKLEAALSLPTLARAALDALTRESAVRLDLLVLIPPRTIPKTTSGKIRRRAARDAWLAGSLTPLLEWSAPAPRDPAEPGIRADSGVGALERVIRAWVAARVVADPNQLAVDEPLSAQGVDSIMAVELAQMLNRMRIGLATHETVVDKKPGGVLECRFWPQTALLFEYNKVVLVREDGTIPQFEVDSWTSLNTFRTNAQIENGGVCTPN